MEEHRTVRLDKIARVGFIGGKLEVYVCTDDTGKIPHIHIRDANSKWCEFETCARLDKPDYFLHGHYTDILYGPQKKAFAEFMEGAPKTNKYETNYEFAVDMWNLNNSTTKVIPKKDNNKIIIPNYNELP